jgi:hypothetical protein
MKYLWCHLCSITLTLNSSGATIICIALQQRKHGTIGACVGL